MLKRSNPNFITRFWGQIPSPSFHYLLQFVTLKGMIVFRHDVYNFWKYKLFFYILSFFLSQYCYENNKSGRGGGLFVLLPLIFTLRNTPTINPNGPKHILNCRRAFLCNNTFSNFYTIFRKNHFKYNTIFHITITNWQFRPFLHFSWICQFFHYLFFNKLKKKWFVLIVFLVSHVRNCIISQTDQFRQKYWNMTNGNIFRNGVVMSCNSKEAKQSFGLVSPTSALIC